MLMAHARGIRLRFRIFASLHEVAACADPAALSDCLRRISTRTNDPPAQNPGETKNDDGGRRQRAKNFLFRTRALNCQTVFGGACARPALNRHPRKLGPAAFKVPVVSASNRQPGSKLSEIGRFDHYQFQPFNTRIRTAVALEARSVVTRVSLVSRRRLFLVLVDSRCRSAPDFDEIESGCSWVKNCYCSAQIAEFELILPLKDWVWFEEHILASFNFNHRAFDRTTEIGQMACTLLKFPSRRLEFHVSALNRAMGAALRNITRFGSINIGGTCAVRVNDTALNSSPTSRTDKQTPPNTTSTCVQQSSQAFGISARRKAAPSPTQPAARSRRRFRRRQAYSRLQIQHLGTLIPTKLVTRVLRAAPRLRSSSVLDTIELDLRPPAGKHPLLQLKPPNRPSTLEVFGDEAAQTLDYIHRRPASGMCDWQSHVSEFKAAALFLSLNDIGIPKAPRSGAVSTFCERNTYSPHVSEFKAASLCLVLNGIGVPRAPRSGAVSTFGERNTSSELGLHLEIWVATDWRSNTNLDLFLQAQNFDYTDRRPLSDNDSKQLPTSE
ncbi:hypothetical protein R3P38DRAFT_2764789 [Favolaschia claudopus]|uniref:Uncharacterized protein n=1 Tax=Favolaschia claudopus TaxID=2862362 RepID=A0AAW0DE94_9AGAR